MNNPLMPGMMLHARYVIRRALGQGGMGAVYLAEDQTLPGRFVTGLALCPAVHLL